MGLLNISLSWGLGVFPACREDLFEFLLDLGVLWHFNAILCFAAARVVVVKLTSNDFATFPRSPLNVTISVGADCIAHDVTVAPVSVRCCGSWMLAEGSEFPSLIRVP